MKKIPAMVISLLIVLVIAFGIYNISNSPAVSTAVTSANDAVACWNSNKKQLEELDVNFVFVENLENDLDSLTIHLSMRDNTVAVMLPNIGSYIYEDKSLANFFFATIVDSFVKEDNLSYGTDWVAAMMSESGTTIILNQEQLMEYLMIFKESFGLS